LVLNLLLMEEKAPSQCKAVIDSHCHRLRPLFTLQHASKTYSNANSNGEGSNVEKKGTDVSSVCFLTRPSGKLLHYDDPSHNINPSDSDSDDDASFLQDFQCRSRVFRKKDSASSSSLLIDQATALELGSTNTLLASSHANGEAWLWDMNRRSITCPLVSPTDERKEGPGVTICRLGNHRHHNTFLYQTRDIDGTVTIHDVNGSDSPCKIVSAFKSYSQTFCAATTSMSCQNIIAMPSAHESFVTLRDLRVNPMDAPIAVIHGAGVADRHDWRKEGMLMSLSLCNTDSDGDGDGSGGTKVLGCGMESGSIFFHDLTMMGRRAPLLKCTTSDDELCYEQSNFTSIKLGNDPILCLDSCSSCDYASNTKTKFGRERKDRNKKTNSIVTIAGIAGDAAELLALPTQERGTVAIVKTTFSACREKKQPGAHTDARNTSSRENTAMKTRIRARVGTCKLSEDISQGGKPGVGACHFRPDGRVFAVGGWDKRVRIYSRTTANLLAVLNGPNDDAVTCLDWLTEEEELVESGVLVTGSGDGKISLWRAFPK